MQNILQLQPLAAFLCQTSCNLKIFVLWTVEGVMLDFLSGQIIRLINNYNNQP